MKLLIIGAAGLIGGEINSYARASGLTCVGTYRNTASPGLTKLDAGDHDAVCEALDRHQPSAVVYTGGMTSADACESNPAQAMRENAEWPTAAAHACHQRGIHFTWFSSAYVFDGHAGPYDEDAVPSPINAYGRAKLAGEQGIREATIDRALILRVIWVYGPELQGKNFAYQIRRARLAGQELEVAADQLGNPTPAQDIAATAVQWIQAGTHGLRHVAGPNPECSRIDWALQLAEAFDAAREPAGSGFQIVSTTTAALGQPARRPLKAGLISRHGIPLATPSTSLVDVVRRITVAKRPAEQPVC